MRIQQNISLKPYNTFGMKVDAKYFTAVDSVDSLLEVLSTPEAKNNPVSVIGGGSNILLTKNVDGLIIRNEIEGILDTIDIGDYYLVKVGAGMNWHQFVIYCIHQGMAGVENLALIPGSVGASPIQNIGAYGVELKDIFHSLEAVHLRDLQQIQLTHKDCAFGYRDSIFKRAYKNQFVITSVTFKLSKKASYNISYGAIKQELDAMGVKELSLVSIAQAVMNIRNSKLPNPDMIGNAGSFFKNPEISEAEYQTLKKSFPEMSGYSVGNGFIKLAAGWLIEQCGWKGYRKGDAGCYDKQALVLVNHGLAQGSEIYNLSEDIVRTVHDKFGIMLEREVNVW